ncbi:MAG: hypothetical protein QOE03_2945 [Micromonosporaceae bacterium]|nr:hypothetical protein [Micromonosporaceae bacterium]
MTEANFGDVDLDRLADYVGGALEGTPDETAVAELVITDPDWTRAHAALVAADVLVRTDLAVVAARSEPMPADVVSRLTAALAAEPPVEPAAGVADAGPGRPHLSALPGGRTDAAAERTRRLPQRRWSAIAGVAAAVMVVGFGAVSVASRFAAGTDSTSSSSTDSKAGPALGRQPGSASDTAAGPAVINASGVDYDASSLAALAARPSVRGNGLRSSNAAAGGNLEAASPVPQPFATVPEALRPLSDPGTRGTCVNAITARYGGTPVLLDYARYQGSPALVVLLDGVEGVAGRTRVVVVGPSCGAGTVGIDERYSTRIG